MPKPNISKAVQSRQLAESFITRYADGYPNVTGSERLAFADLTTEFLNKLRDLVSAKVKDGDLSADDWSQAVKTARAHAGGMGKAKKKMPPKEMPMTASEGDESLEEQIRELCAALNAKYPGTNGYSGQYWIQSTYDSYLIVSDSGSGEYYKIPYMENGGDDIVFGDPVEVEQEWVEIEMADVCAKGGNLHLFVEHSFSDPPAWMPLMPKPGEFKHPEYGKISITTERNANFIANFQNGVYQSKLPINAEHNPSDDGAFGWIVGMRQNDDGSVDAQVNWTDLGTEAIENDRFAYVSPEWVDSYKKNDGSKHKDVLLGAALTVRPFFKEDAMRPLVASERGLELARAEKDSEGSITFVFTAATPIQQEVVMPLDKEARRKRFAEIAKGFKGELDTHLKFMDVIAGDMSTEQAEDLVLFKSYVARETALATEMEAPKNFAELQGKVTTLETANTELKTANESLKTAVDGLTKENRRKRFSDVAKGFNGEADKHIKQMEFIADHDEKGEDSELFKEYVETQRSLAEQLKASDLFRSIGDDRGGEIKTASEELDSLAHKYIEDHKTDNLTYAQAYTRVLEQNPDVYARHKAETRKEVN